MLLFKLIASLIRLQSNGHTFQSPRPESPAAIGGLSHHRSRGGRQDTHAEGGSRRRGTHLHTRPTEAHRQQFSRLSGSAQQERQKWLHHSYL